MLNAPAEGPNVAVKIPTILNNLATIEGAPVLACWSAINEGDGYD